MNIDEVKQKLETLNQPQLQDFVLDLYLQYPELKVKIETLVLLNNPEDLAKSINKRIQSIKRGRKFIDYRNSWQFSRDLQSIVDDTESGLLDVSPKQAFLSAEKFLATAESVLNRVDDSSGTIGEVYRDAVLLWLTAASIWRDSKINWMERVYQLYQQNDYGVLDPLLPNSHLLLDQDQLHQLAWRYESELRQAKKTHIESGKLNFAELHAGVALSAMAKAMKDPALYEKSVLISSPEPNGIQKKDIASVYLEFNQPDKALRWLNDEWEARFEFDRLQMLDETYEKLNDKDQQKQIRYQLYQSQPSYELFKRYQMLLNEEEKLIARTEAVKQAENGGNLAQSANLPICYCNWAK